MNFRSVLTFCLGISTLTGTLPAFADSASVVNNIPQISITHINSKEGQHSPDREGATFPDSQQRDRVASSSPNRSLGSANNTIKPVRRYARQACKFRR